MTELIREDPAQPNQPSLGSRLTGWKDIAAYLDRGVRTAQRWERDFGLPVRRIGREGAESVFAFTAEIDRWLESNSAARAQGRPVDDSGRESSTPNEQPAEGQTPDPEPLPRPDLIHPDHRRQQRWLWLLAAAVVVLGAVGMWREASTGRLPKGPLPAAWRVEADTLVVIDAEGQTVWAKQFDVELDEQFYESQPKNTMGGVADFDRDGRREILFIANPANGAWDHSRLYLFNDDGSLRWSYQHRGTVTFGNETLGGPWVVHRVFVTEDPDQPGNEAIWVVSRDPAVFPAVLQRLDIATGQPAGDYWSNGWINTLSLWRSPGGPLLLVGGVSNDQKGPSLAVLKPNRLQGRAPAEQDKYRCVTCAPIDPEAFIVFPKPQRFKMSPGSGSVFRLDTGSATAPVTAVVAYAVAPTGAAATAVFRFDTSLQPLIADFSDGYDSVYAQFVRDGTIAPTGPIPQDAAQELLPLKRWQGGKFVRMGVRTPGA
jgi:hypothetical protein